MNVRAIEVSLVPLSQAAILERQRERFLSGEELDAIVFVLQRGIAPIPECGGSGFRIGPDPVEGVRVFAHAEMKRMIDEQE